MSIGTTERHPSDTAPAPPLRPMSATEAALAEDAVDLVQHVVRWTTRNWPSHVDEDELVSAGMYGLAQAAQRWEAALGVPFRAFASVRIRGAVLDAARSLDPLGRTLRDRYRSLETARSELTAQLGRDPSPEELATAQDISSTELADILRRAWLARPERLERPAPDAGGAGPGVADIADLHAIDPEVWVQQRELRDVLRHALQRLPERHRLVITALYLEGRSADSVAKFLGVSASRISQIHQQALRRLRAQFEGDFDDHDIE